MPLQATLVKPFCISVRGPFLSYHLHHLCFLVLSVEITLSNRCFYQLQRENEFRVRMASQLWPVLTSFVLRGVTFSANKRCSAWLCLENSFHSSQVLLAEDPLDYLIGIGPRSSQSFILKCCFSVSFSFILSFLQVL